MAEDRTVRLHRVFAAPPNKIYRAFVTPEAFIRWIPPDGYFGTVHSMDARTGGAFKMSFTNMTSGHSHGFGGTYLELIPDQLIRYTDVFDDPNLPGELVVTVKLSKVTAGTDVRIEQQNIPAAIPLEACYLGWQQSLNNLARLVEPNIPG